MASSSANGSAVSYRSPPPAGRPADSGVLERKLFVTPARPPTNTVAPSAAVTWHGVQSEPRRENRQGGLPPSGAPGGHALSRPGVWFRPALPDRVSQILRHPQTAVPGAAATGEGRALHQVWQEACASEIVPAEVASALGTLIAAADAAAARAVAPLPGGFLDALNQAYEAQFAQRQSWPHRIQTLAHWTAGASTMAEFAAAAVPPPPAGAPPPETPLERVERLLRPLGPLPPALGPFHADPPQTWEALMERHPPGVEGQGVRSSPALRRWAEGQPERIESLHLLFAHAEAQVRAGRQAPDFLDGLHKAYQRGTTVDENLLQPDRTVVTLACAVGSRFTAAQLDRTVTRTRYVFELLRSLATPLLIYMPLGWGGNSLLAGKWAEDREQFSTAEKFWTTFLLATLIGLGEALHAVARQGGIGSMYTRNVTNDEVPGKGRQIVAADDLMISVRATSFIWFMPTLASVLQLVRDDDPLEQLEQQAKSRFWVNIFATVGLAMHNYLIPIATGHNTIRALDGRNEDDFRALVHSMNQPAWHGSLTYFGNAAKGFLKAIWNPPKDATTVLQKLLPESTTVLRFMLRTSIAHLILNAGPMMTEALMEEHGFSQEEASYRAGLLTSATISLGWGMGMELTNQLCQRMARSDAREKKLADELREAHAVRMRAAVPAAVEPPPHIPR